ncbi:MAG: PQQ-binding-like beta-propeller repeat protein [Planctomycetota bacterium]
MSAVLRSMLLSAIVVACAGGVLSTANAQQSAVFVDDSVAAAESLQRIPELIAAGNMGEAARIAQSLLESEGDRVVATAQDPAIFISVRARIHELLLANPALLERYRTTEESRALRQLAGGQHSAAERSRLLTPSGFDAAIRLAQEHLESARFDAAYWTLLELDSHPDRKSDHERSKRVALAAAELTRYLGTPGAKSLAARYVTDAALPVPDSTPIVPPQTALALSRNAIAPAGPLTEAEVAKDPLASVALSRVEQVAPRSAVAGLPSTAWALPGVVGDAVYLNDGLSIGAWDRATLVPLWRFTPRAVVDDTDTLDENQRLPLDIRARQFEECSTITVASGIVVATTGFATGNFRREHDPRTHALDAATGRVLWSVDPAALDKQLSESSVRGPALLSGDTVVLTLGRLSTGRRIASSLMIGLDASTGALRWMRPLANVGVSVYARPSRVAEFGACEDGIVYKADALGVVAAVEAATGRPVWLRRSQSVAQEDMMRYGPLADRQPWTGAVPIVEHASIIVLEPGTGDIVRLDRASGALLERRRADQAGAPKYLVRVGETLAAVGTQIVNFIPLADLAGGQSRLGPSYRDPGAAGRAFAAGTRLGVPVVGGIAMMNPANPGEARFIDLAESGNAVVTDGQLVVATPSNLTSHLSWTAAEPRLRAWMSQRPDDPAPCLTYINIASRAGKLAGLPGVADALLAIVDADPSDVARQGARHDLFRALLTIVRAAQHPAPGGPMPDLALVDPLLSRLARAADAPDERALQLLEAASIHEALGRTSAAIEAYQQVLQDPDLAQATIDAPLGLGPGDRAWETARDRLAAFLGKAGYRPYEGFAAQAARELADLGPGAAAPALEQLARRFPLAHSACVALLAAAELHQRGGSRNAFAADLGAAVECASTIARLTRDAPVAELALAAGQLTDLLIQSGRVGEANRLVKRLAADNPGLRLVGAGGAQDPARMLESFGKTLAAIERRADLSGSIERRPQTLIGWTIAKARLTSGPGVATDQLPLYALGERVAGLWASRAEDGRLAPLWSRAYDHDVERPSFVRVDWDSSFLFWPAGPAGPSLERVSSDGTTLWRTPGFDSLFPPEPPDNSPEPEKFTAPLDGEVDRDGIVVDIDDRTAVLVKRSGRAIGIDLGSGKVLWARDLGMNGVYDFTLVSGRLVAVGFGAREAASAIVVADARTGEGTLTLGTPDVPLKSHTRWVREVAGLAIIALDAQVFALDPVTSELKWKVTDKIAQNSIDAWGIDNQIFLLTSEQKLWTINAATGETRKEDLDTARRLGMIEQNRPVDEPANVVVGLRPGGSAIVSENGLVCYDESGKRVGFDAAGIDGVRRLFAIGEDTVAFIEAAPGTERSERRAAGLQLVSMPSGKTRVKEHLGLFDTPSAIAAIDGHLAVSVGPLTVILTLTKSP